METINQLRGFDYVYLLFGFITVLAAWKFIISLWESTIGKLGLETKGMRKKREEHELLIQTAKTLSELQEKHQDDLERSNRRDEEISADIKKLTQMFVDKEIDDMRWEINNFATKVSEGSPCNKDSFKHCIHVYEKYEKILEENGLENGEVEISMELIKEAYQKKLKEGVKGYEYH